MCIAESRELDLHGTLESEHLDTPNTEHGLVIILKHGQGRASPLQSVKYGSRAPNGQSIVQVDTARKAQHSRPSFVTKACCSIIIGVHIARYDQIGIRCVSRVVDNARKLIGRPIEAQFLPGSQVKNVRHVIELTWQSLVV